MSDFLNPAITDRTKFKNWILVNLGWPTITPELTEEQLDVCINDALEEFTEYAAQDTKFYGISLHDYVAGKGYTMPSDVVAITELYDQGMDSGMENGINPFSMNMMYLNAGMVPNPFQGLNSRSGWFDYHLAMQWIDTAYIMTGKGFEWDFNPRTRQLILNPDPVKYFHINRDRNNGTYYIVAQCICLRPEEQNYGETWVKKMALANSKVMLGNIRTTYSNVSMLGGTSVDGDKILNQGTTEQEKLRADLQAKYPTLGIWIG